MNDSAWLPALAESALPDETITPAFPKGVSIIFIRKAGQVYALRNRCAHMSCTLASGRLDGYTLQCPCHEWRYDITTGEFLAARELRIASYPCKSENGMIYVKLEEQ